MSKISDTGIRRHNILFSLYQIRLIGLLVLAATLSRIAVAILSTLYESSYVRLSAYGLIANSLPLLPLGVGLYLIGASHRRRPYELAILPWLCKSLNILVLFCGLIIPVLIAYSFHSVMTASLSADLTPYQLELISPGRLLPAMASCFITAIGFLFLGRQMNRLFRRYNVTAFQFFGSRMT